MSTRLFLIYARARSGVIGSHGKLPWHIPADLKRFKALTIGKPMIMGRKTFESFRAPLPGRRHIVLTRDPHWSAVGAEVVHSPEEALALAGAGEVAVIGGAEINALLIARAERIELTEVHGDYAGDTFMPAPGPEWTLVAREDHAQEGAVPAFSFLTLERAR